MSDLRPFEALTDLVGWKDVAAYLGRSVRTVQRWEKELGLPVRRVRTQAGEVIYASRRDLDSWLASRVGSAAASADPNGDLQEPNHRVETSEEVQAPASRSGGEAPGAWVSSRRVRIGALSLGVVVVVGVIAAGVLWLTTSKAQPSSWAVEDGALAILDGAGRRLWTHRFDFPLDAARMNSSNIRYGDTVAAWVVLADVDGDGNREVLAVPYGQPPSGGLLHCFERDGRLRFIHEVRRTVHFGRETFGPPFVSMPPLVVGHGARTSIWVPSLHSPYFPAVIHKLAADGRVLGEYWLAGHPTTLREIERSGRRLLVVGSTRNEDFTAALSVLDAKDPTGSAPATLEDYRCHDCPAVPPVVFMSFPRLELGRLAGQRSVLVAIGETPGGLRAQVQYLPPGALSPSPCGGEGYYHLDDSFRIVSADLGDAYMNCHARLRLDGRLDHDLGPPDVAELFPVRAWYKGVLETIERPSPAMPMPAGANQEAPPPAGTTSR